MQRDQRWVLSDIWVGQQQDKAHRAPNAQEDEDDGDERELHISHGGEGVGGRPVGQDGTVLREGCMLRQSIKSETIKRK